jgi:hypothetical protein
VTARRAGVAVAHLGRLDGAVGLEVTARHEVEDVLAPRSSAPVIHAVPSTTRGSSRYRMPVDFSRPSASGADVALGQRRVVREVLLLERLDAAGSTWAPRRFSSTSRSPGTPMASGSRLPSGSTSMTTTFFRVSPAVQARPSARGWSAFSGSDQRVDGRGVGGVLDVAAGREVTSTASGVGTRTASTFAAYPQFTHRT